MGSSTGIHAQLGFKAESSYGTAVVVDRFLPLVSEGIELDVQRLESKGIIAGRRVLDSDQWAAGNKTVAGPVTVEAQFSGIGALLKQCFGAVSSTGAGTGLYAHTFTPGDLEGDSLTMQVGRPGTAGTVHPFTWAGCKFPKWSIGAKVGEIAQINLDVVGKSQTTGTALASASYPTDNSPVTFVHGSVTFAGSAVKLAEVNLSGDNKLDVERRFVGQDTIDEPLEIEQRDYQFAGMMEFEDLTEYNRFVNGSTAAIVVTFASGSHSLAFTGIGRFDKGNPKVDGRGRLMLPVAAKLLGDTDAAALTAVLTNADATP